MDKRTKVKTRSHTPPSIGFRHNFKTVKDVPSDYVKITP